MIMDELVWIVLALCLAVASFGIAVVLYDKTDDDDWHDDGMGLGV